MNNKSKKVISEEFVKKSLKKWLKENSWSTRYRPSKPRGKGVDILVVNDKASRYFLIEAKGESDKSSVNTNNIIFALGQIVTRMKIIAKHAYLYGVAYPKPLADKAIKKIPYQFAKEIGFYVFSVNKNGEVKRHSHKELKLIQNKK